jgi:hypothetical protein
VSSVSDLPAGVEWLHEPEVEEEQAEAGSGAVVHFVMPWSVRESFRTVVGGLPEQFTSNGVTYTRIVPLEYPGFTNCYAERMRIRGAGRSRLPSSGEMGIEYDWAFATVWFSTPAWSFGGDTPLISMSIETGAEMVTRPGTAYSFPSDNLPLLHNCGVRVPVKDIRMTFFQMPILDRPLYASLAGCVNSTAFMGYSTGTVQYVGEAFDGEQTLGNVTTYTVTQRFRWRAVPHNMIMRPDGADFEAPEDGNGDTMLPEADLNDIFS